MTLTTAQFAGSPATARPRPATIRLTRRGRLVLRGIPVIAAAVAATLAVMPGDSLWTIATTVAPEADVYEVIATIDELNGLEGRAPAPGEELFVPATR